jgi:PleD family two-component response regulator
VSIGVAQFDAETDVDGSSLHGRADQALYESKQKGRNRVTVWPGASRKPKAA